MELPAILVQGIRVQLAQGPLFEKRIDRPHLLALLKDAQRGSFWAVKGAQGYVVPRTGTGPGAVMATDS
eukprot:316472-Pyramimonas_sp.AAC.1